MAYHVEAASTNGETRHVVQEAQAPVQYRHDLLSAKLSEELPVVLLKGWVCRKIKLLAT
jgi:hypothetical protein